MPFAPTQSLTAAARRSQPVGGSGAQRGRGGDRPSRVVACRVAPGAGIGQQRAGGLDLGGPGVGEDRRRAGLLPMTSRAR